jgi:membrane protease subunit HflK
MRDPFARRDHDFEPSYRRPDWRDLQRQLNQWGNRFLWLLLLVVVTLWLASGVYAVGPSDIGLVKQFGRYVRSSQPGLHWRLPYPIESVVVISRDLVRTEEIGFRTEQFAPAQSYREIPEEALMLTGDGNITHAEVVVQYQIKDPEDLAFQIISASDLVKQTAQAVIRERIALRTIDQTLTTDRDVIAIETQQELQKLLDRYNSGIRVVNVRLQDVKPPRPVATAFDDVNSSLQDKERKINDANKYRNDILPRARGDAQRILNEAEAYKQTRILQAQGDVARFVAVWERYQLGKEVTEARLYIETMEEIFPRLQKVVLTQGTGNVLNLLSLQELINNKKEGERR